MGHQLLARWLRDHADEARGAWVLGVRLHHGPPQLSRLAVVAVVQELAAPRVVVQVAQAGEGLQACRRRLERSALRALEFRVEELRREFRVRFMHSFCRFYKAIVRLEAPCSQVLFIHVFCRL